MKKLSTALLTTLFHLPIIFWFFLGISIYRTNGIFFSEIGNIFILSSMIALVFGTAYFTKKINNHLYYSFWLVPLSFGIIMLFKNSWIAIYLLFLSYIAFMLYPIKKKYQYVVYREDKDPEGISMFMLDRFETKQEAEQFIEERVTNTLKKLSINVESESELKEKCFNEYPYKFVINNDEYNLKNLVNIKVPPIFRQRIQNMINGNFILTKNQEILELLSDIENCEILEVNKLQYKIEFVYLKENQTKYLTIEDSYFMSSMAGIGMYFRFDNKPLELVATQTFNVDTKDINLEIKKEPHPKLDDIKSIVRIFYLVHDEAYYKEGKIEIIYKNKEDIVNSYQLYFVDDTHLGAELHIKKYKNIFSFKTAELKDDLKTQILYSYDEKYFYPFYYQNYLDQGIDSNGDLEPVLKRIKHGEDYVRNYLEAKDKIQFIIDNTGVYDYNLTSYWQSHQMIDENVFSSLTEFDKEQLQHFLEVASLYMNDRRKNVNSN